MKVNTDGVLLGAVMTLLPSDRHLLDIGTGTGTIALMAAQRLSSMSGALTEGECPFHIDAIDIDAPSAEEAQENFSSSPWIASLAAHLCPLSEFVPETLLDVIFSNPPYFDNSLVNDNERKTSTRHTMSLSFREILLFASEHLTQEGRLAMVLPTDCLFTLNREARSRGLFLHRLVKVRTTARKQALRMVVEFSRDRVSSPVEQLLTIQENGRYTEEYTDLMKFFYIFC